MSMVKAPDFKQKQKRLTIIVGVFLAINLLLIVLAASSGSKKEDTLARENTVRGLRNELTTLQAALAKGDFSSQASSQEISIQALKLANEMGVTVVSDSSADGKDLIQNREFPVVTTFLEVRGSEDKLLDFLEAATKIGGPATILENVEWKQLGELTDLKFKINSFLNPEIS